MPARLWLALPLLATLAVACGGDDDTDLADGDTDDTGALAVADRGDAMAASAGDSIPMEITLVASGGSTNNNGTFTARGMGDRCAYDPNVSPGATGAAWAATFFTEDTTGVQLLDLQVGAPVNDTTSRFSLTAAAGTSTAAGIATPMRYMVATWPSGAQLGSGTVTVRREGEGVRFEVNAVDGASRTRLSLTATCARLGSVN